MNRILAVVVILALWFPASLPAAQSDERPETVDLRIENGSLLQLLERMARDLRMGLVVDADSTAVMQQKITLFALETPWAKALDLFRDQFGLEITIDDGLLLVSDAQRARLERLELRLYDLRTMTTGTTQFPGPQLGIGRAAGPTSEVADSSPPDIGRFMDMIQFFSEPEGWMEMGVGIDEINGTLAISNIPEVHEQIGHMLQGMERDAAMVINATVYRQDDIDNLPNEISPEDWPAVRAELGRPVGNVLVKNGQRNHLASALSYNRVSGYAEVQGRIIPKRSPISEGLVVDLTLQQSAYRGLVSTARIQLVEPAGLSSRPMHFAENELTSSEKAEQVSHGSGDTRLLQPGGASVHIIGDATVIIHYQVIGPAQEDD